MADDHGALDEPLVEFVPVREQDKVRLGEVLPIPPPRYEPITEVD